MSNLHESVQSIYWTGNAEGWALILPGHGHAPEGLTKVAQAEDYDPHHAEEVWLHYCPRIKWCDRVDGYGCDFVGDWHAHWFGVKPNAAAESAKWTVLTREAKP